MLGRLRALWSRWRAEAGDPPDASAGSRVEAVTAGALGSDEGPRTPASPAEAEQGISRVIVGLGNPGPEYATTRHNAGFLVLERLVEKGGSIWRDAPEWDSRTAVVTLAGERCLLVAPQTFMNRSGQAVEKVCAALPALDPKADLLVVYDDMDLPTGRIRLRPSGGAGGHRGIADILAVLETKAVDRLRFGVGHPGKSEAVLDWVLAPFPDEEHELLAAALERATAAIEVTVARGIQTAMGQFNGIS